MVVTNSPLGANNSQPTANGAVEGKARASPLSSLTEKQRAVLDLLIQHNTSKEIARRLDISPHTVDQRIEFAKRKLGAGSRNALASRYRQMVEVYDHLTYEFSPMGTSAFPFDVGGANDPEHTVLATHSDRIEPDADDKPVVDYRVIPEMFEGRYGTLMRIGAIGLFAAVLIFIAIGGLALFSQLSEVLAR